MCVYACVCVYLINLLWCGQRKGGSDVGAGLTALDHEDPSGHKQHLQHNQRHISCDSMSSSHIFLSFYTADISVHPNLDWANEGSILSVRTKPFHLVSSFLCYVNKMRMTQGIIQKQFLQIVLTMNTWKSEIKSIFQNVFCQLWITVKTEFYSFHILNVFPPLQSQKTDSLCSLLCGNILDSNERRPSADPGRAWLCPLLFIRGQ